ncbi:ligand-binding sensor domain-containing protein/signal transduction histidine kinase [Ereboglobus sp. PH5-10]|uniref:sensor histidine kinase n=1 Tax=Ereboglobus sp. PH5-10 TaxID=2940629 RepID=UPI002404A6A8|nr:sensor histidine kinase [Ereboglobus sp. PH5-10]MDF9827034.1 ligand-binding sensor domain-containing protein/signal transduction histidine kinase [Ereboglobus sp. PH5-10]
MTLRAPIPKSSVKPPLHGRRGLFCIGCIALVWITALGTCLDAQETAPNIPTRSPGFITRAWDAENGLPHNAVNKVLRDSRGFLWVATQLGLARFDGRQFVTYRVPDDFTLGGYNIRALALEDESTLLMLTGGDKLVRLRDGVFSLHPANEKVEGSRMRELVVDAHGDIWIGLETSKFLRWSGGELQTFGADEGVNARGASFTFVNDQQKRVWIAGGDFLGWHDADGLHEYAQKTGNSFYAAPARSGGVWVAAREHLAKIENGRWRIVYSHKDWPAARLGIQDIFEANDGALWIATKRDGVFRLMDDVLTHVPMPQERAMSVIDDIDGNVWLGMHGGGLVRAKPQRHTMLNTAAGFPSDVSSSVCEDSAGALWCANQSGGLVRVKDGSVSVAALASAGSMPYASTVCADKQGRVWAGSVGGLFWTTVEANGPRDDNGDAQWLLHHYAALGRANVQSLFCASNGDLWVSWGGRRLGVLRDGKLHEFTQSDGFYGERVMGIVERKNGDIWIGITRDTLLRFDPSSGKFEKHPLHDSTRFNRIHSLFVDGEDRLWLGTIQGLLLWRGTESRLFTQADGLPDDVINQVVEDDHRHLWINGRRGIFHVSIKQLLATADTPGRKVSAILLGHDENLDGISGLLGSQPMSCKTRDGRVWFITYRGVIGFEPPDSGAPRNPLPVYIDAIATNGDEPFASPSPGAKIHIPPGASPLEIRFTALNFSTPERTQIRRQLVGFDPEWIDADNERKAIYPRLPPGRYVFHVQAGDADSGIQTQSEASLVIIVAAAWWQTWWARALALLVFAAIVAWFARGISTRVFRRRLMRLQYEHAIERERSRIARDLHDDIGGRVTKISFVANKLQRKTGDPLQKEQLGGIATLARHLMEELHRVIWTIDSKNDSWRDLAVYMTRYAQRHLADTGILCTVEGAESIPDLPVTPDVQHHLLAITKESLNNMLKHSGADCITIQLSTTGGNFCMRIDDNGRGFDTTAQPNRDGNGLKNMRTRMAEIDARIDITSQPGKGTQITVELPLKCKPPIFL